MKKNAHTKSDLNSKLKGDVVLSGIMKLADQCDDEDALIVANKYIVDRIRKIRQLDNINTANSLYVAQLVKIKDECLRGKADRLAGKVGTIVKINITKAIVKFDNTSWTIPMRLLEPANTKASKSASTKGKSYLFNCWIHPIEGGDDYQESIEILGASSQKDAEKRLRKILGEKSDVVNDYSLARAI